jgi:chemotaxis protein methyltransferase CheR
LPRVSLDRGKAILTNPSVLQNQAATAEDLADPALCEIRDLLYRVSGIYQMDFQFSFLVTRCRRRMKILNVSALAAYFRYLAAPKTGQEEIRNLLNEITIGETYFFRNQAQIDALRKIILPKVAALPLKQEQKEIRVWSAGCSTGEEPYTLAIALLDEITQRHQDWTLEILATDINDESLRKAAAGQYNEYAVRRIRPELKSRYFCSEGSLFRISDAVRGIVKFARLNFEDQPAISAMGEFDFIFCCNVLIYFDQASKQRAIVNFERSLLPGGYLFLGDCESLFHTENQFRLLHYPEATAYRKAVAGEIPGDAV